MRKQNIPNSRTAALRILDLVNLGSITLDTLLDENTTVLKNMSRRDRGLFNQLVYGVLRWRLLLDAVIKAYSSRSLKKIHPSILNILRIGLFQTRFMDRIPPSAAVNTAVDLARMKKGVKAAGFVNAVLRNALRDPDRFRLPDPVEDPANHLAVAASFPYWLVSRWIKHIGISGTRKRCDAINDIPPITIRCNKLINDLTELTDAMHDQVQSIEILNKVPGGANLTRPLCPIPEMKAFLEGRFAVQDGAAQLVSRLLAPQPGETVLDACAGLGGKTTHLAQMMKNQGTIVAMDHIPAKLASLEKEAQRLKIAVVQTCQWDLNHSIDLDGRPLFDRILLDAPCSGLGVLRRNPDAKWSTRNKDIARCAKRQQRFIDHLAPLVKKGGSIVYAVCSMEPEENEQVIQHFLKNHPNFVIIGKRSTGKDTVDSFLNEEGFLKTAPDTHGMDGFFATRLKRFA